MSEAFDQIIDLLREKGNDLRQSDVLQIESLMVNIPLDQASDAYGTVWEAIALIVNDPLYEGDVPTIE